MDELEIFVRDLKNIAYNVSDIGTAREVISKINEFLYNTHEDIGTVTALGESFTYLSEFHKYWHKNYKDILGLKVETGACEAVAKALHEVYIRTNGRAFKEIYDTFGLKDEEICLVRLLTANQDFRGSRSFKELADIYISDPSVFDIKEVYNSPENFIKDIDATSLSQTDKRTMYAKNIAKFLLDEGVEPFRLIDKYNGDLVALRNALIENENAGYGNKKADMFIRDMVVLNVWKKYKNFDKINVASDVNTIRVALRTGILHSEIPLLSSFMDIFCYQYSYVDEMNAKAWYEVWRIWNELYPTETIESPCMLDYFIYNVVGKQFCKDILCLFKCENGHSFYWHSARNKTCQVCYDTVHKKTKATLVKKLLPCESNKGYLAIEKSDFVRSCMAQPNYSQCPFKEICEQYGNKKLMPPKSISIKGQTGWTSAYSSKETGGGGLMA